MIPGVWGGSLGSDAEKGLERASLDGGREGTMRRTAVPAAEVKGEGWMLPLVETKNPFRRTS